MGRAMGKMPFNAFEKLMSEAADKMAELQDQKAALVAAIQLTMPKMRRDNDDPEGVDWSDELAALESAVFKAAT